MRALVDDPIDELCERLMAELTTTSTNDDDTVLLCLRFSLGHPLVLTVGEASTNAIEHAYHGRRPGVIDLSISDGGDDALHVEVRDHGRWREVVDRPGRGYGAGSSVD